MKTAEQAVHDVIWKRLSPLVNGNIYESRPMKEVGYPFADFEEIQTGFRGTKSGVLSKVSLDFNVWDAEDNRKNVSGICGTAFRESAASAGCLWIPGFPPRAGVRNTDYAGQDGKASALAGNG